MPPKSIGLALSGGGVRAAAFHAGVLRYLAEKSLLESVAHVSSVSGGSLFTGLVFSISGYKWPASFNYISVVLPRIRALLTTESLQYGAVYRLLFNPLNWRFVLSRANVVAQTIKDLWGIDVPLRTLGVKPAWSINATTGETGRRFRFKAGRMGDYELGYADAADFPLSYAMAVSAAFPGGIGPLSIRPKEFHWSKREYWESADGEKPVELPFTRLHLYDGGIYDNLGIEPLFDVGKQTLKANGPDGINYLVVSDAGAALARGPIPPPYNPLRFRRVADIAFDQTRALRVRALVHFLQSNPAAGAYLQLGANPVESINRLSKGEENVGALLAQPWLNAIALKRAAAFPTTLRQMTPDAFDMLEKHGFETTKWNTELFVDNMENNPSKTFEGDLTR